MRRNRAEPHRNRKISELLPSWSIQTAALWRHVASCTARSWLHSSLFVFSLDHLLCEALPSWNLLIPVCMDHCVAMVLTVCNLTFQLPCPWPSDNLWISWFKFWKQNLIVIQGQLCLKIEVTSNNHHSVLSGLKSGRRVWGSTSKKKRMTLTDSPNIFTTFWEEGVRNSLDRI